MFGVTGMIRENETNGDISRWVTNKKKAPFSRSFYSVIKCFYDY